jgi:beta-lactamase regulating signal transducer with metallopeptidase domain
VELAIRHELVHLARGDHWSSAGVALMRSLLPLHPTARRVHADCALAREEAVDALVAPMAPRAYAHLLLDAAAFRDDLEPMVAMSGTQLAHRIERLTHGSPLRRAGLASSALAFLAMGTLLAAKRKTGTSIWLSAPRQCSPFGG